MDCSNEYNLKCKLHDDIVGISIVFKILVSLILNNKTKQCIIK